MRRTLFVLAVFASLPALSAAQHGSGIVTPATVPPREAAQFDFLAGEWSITAVQRYPGLAGVVHGGPKMTGSWKAHRAFDGFGVEDELRLADASGNPVAYTSAMRVFDASTHTWAVSSLDVYRMKFSLSSAEWRDGKMSMLNTSRAADGKETLTRLRFFDITATTFTAWQDRSTDNGKTWEEGRLRIVAKRLRTAPH